MGIIAVIVVEQPVFDERRHDLVEFAAAKTEGQQPAVFAVAKRQGVAATARAGAAPVVTLALPAELAGDGAALASSCPRESDHRKIGSSRFRLWRALLSALGLTLAGFLAAGVAGAGAGADEAAKSGGASGGATVGVAGPPSPAPCCAQPSR